MWFRVQVACRARTDESHAEIWFQIINVYIISKSNSSNTSAMMLMRNDMQHSWNPNYSSINLLYCRGGTVFNADG